MKTMDTTPPKGKARLDQKTPASNYATTSSSKPRIQNEKSPLKSASISHRSSRGALNSQTQDFAQMSRMLKE